MEENDNKIESEFLYSEKKADTSIQVGDKSSFVNVFTEDVDSIANDL